MGVFNIYYAGAYLSKPLSLRFTYAYINDHAMQNGFCKPGSNNFSESAIWRCDRPEIAVLRDRHRDNGRENGDYYVGVDKELHWDVYRV